MADGIPNAYRPIRMVHDATALTFQPIYRAGHKGITRWLENAGFRYEYDPNPANIGVAVIRDPVDRYISALFKGWWMDNNEDGTSWQDHLTARDGSGFYFGELMDGRDARVAQYFKRQSAIIAQGLPANPELFRLDQVGRLRGWLQAQGVADPGPVPAQVREAGDARHVQARQILNLSRVRQRLADDIALYDAADRAV